MIKSITSGDNNYTATISSKIFCSHASIILLQERGNILTELHASKEWHDR